MIHKDNDNIVAITETWWDEIHNWKVLLEGYKVFKSNGHNKREALYVRNHYTSAELYKTMNESLHECIWVNIKGKKEWYCQMCML